VANALEEPFAVVYEGQHDFECLIAVVRRIREDAHRDPETGDPRPNFKALDEDEKFLLAEQLHREGSSVRTAAKYLGISPTTLHKYWPTTDAGRVALARLANEPGKIEAWRTSRVDVHATD
jgi:DNA-binding NtrC family response regulator